MRIAQKTHVEHEIGIARKAARKAKGQDRQCWRGRQPFAKPRAHFEAQVIARGACRVDDMVGPASQRAEQFAFARNAIACRAIKREGVTAAGFGIATLELGTAAIEKDSGNIVAAFAHCLDALDDLLRIEPTRAAVDAERERSVIAGPFG